MFNTYTSLYGRLLRTSTFFPCYFAGEKPQTTFKRPFFSGLNRILKGHQEDPYDRSIIYFQKDIIALIYSLQSSFVFFSFFFSSFMSLVTFAFRSIFFFFLPKYTRIIYRRAHPENNMVETFFIIFSSLTKPVNEWLFYR